MTDGWDQARVAEIRKLNAEVERLLAALTDLVNETDWVQFEWKGQVAWDRAARLALAAQPAATGEGACPRCGGDRVIMRDKDRKTVEVVPCPRCE